MGAGKQSQSQSREMRQNGLEDNFKPAINHPLYLENQSTLNYMYTHLSKLVAYTFLSSFCFAAHSGCTASYYTGETKGMCPFGQIGN